MEMKKSAGTEAAATTSFSPPRMCSLALIVIFNIAATLFLHHHHAIAQSSQPSSPRRTDPTEVEALNSLFRKWNISSTMSKLPWNHTGNGDPCTGYARTADDKIRDNYDLFNPSILCDCSSNNGSTCHIIRLTATRLNITGTIPDELKTFSKLDNLQIADNYFVGPLPAFIGNFSAMKYLSIGKNALSGDIPKELGNLQELISLGMVMNNFSGSLPPELGNLKSLEKLYIESIGVSGEIPSTFAKLKKLKRMWASDNNLGGKVPEFLGNFTNLQVLRLQGNSFQGPIPSSLGNLQGLQELRLGDLSNGTSSLEFTANMKLLSTLILRNAKISDTIPTDIGKFQDLHYLDLSFNNLTGTLPPDLFNMKSLENLYLGNNSIYGNVPRKKSGKLLNIDLSYNELSGSILPPWAGEENLQLNLVANNFDIDSSNSLSWGLGCLQRDVPCGRGSPNYYSFAINCGSNESLTYDGADYERDNMDLLTASYHVTNSQRWAVSNVGTFMDSPKPSYVLLDSSSNIQNTTNVKIFQSARLSPSSLRYYGLRLENGNYTVRLLFAELAIQDDFTSYSFGKRIFNIYVQGILVERDFDIRMEAGERSFKAIKREYTALVTKNFMEIHFFWAGKGTCCIPTRGSYGPLISAISITPNFKPSVTNEPPNFGSTNKKYRNIAIIVGTVGGISALFLIILGIFIWRRKKNKPISHDDNELVGLAVVPNSYSYTELKNATKGFSSSNKLGEGGFGAVFKGILNDGTPVAVKQLSVSSLQGNKQFVTEVATISAVKHRNLVKLLGCCFEENKRLLVYEYLENGSLDRVFFGKSKLQLDWPTRSAICLGIAKGIAYLHEESNARIVHRDIKASNILLDNDLNAKISDFGLAKLFDDKLTHISTRVAGTIGYLAPEYAMRGHLTEKVDVFSFGIVVLEILCGRPNTDASLDAEKMCLIEWAWRLHEEKNDLEMLDPTLPYFDREEASRMIIVAFLCTQVNPMMRPPMSRVVAMLIGDIEVTDIPSKPSYLTDWQFDDLSSQATDAEKDAHHFHLPSVC